MRYKNRQDVAGKVDWEGGLDSVLEYGLSYLDMPEGDQELIDAWYLMQHMYSIFATFRDKVQRLLPESGDWTEEE